MKCSHIIQQNNTFLSNDASSICKQAGLSQKHETQNGLLLCAYCHEVFDLLRRFVDVMDGKVAVKIVNETSDVCNLHWHRAMLITQSSRNIKRKLFWNNTDTKAVEINGEMALYFIQNDPNILPNKVALEFPQKSMFDLENGWRFRTR